MKGGGQHKELAHQALQKEAALQEEEALQEEAARVQEEAARKEREAKEAFQKRLHKDAEYAAKRLSEWHENQKKSSCNIMGGRGRIKNTFRKKNKSKKYKSKRIKKNKRNSRKYSRKSLKK